jgi:proteasome alpha subunit
MFSAVGNQADIEAIRTGAVDVAHREGFTRSPEDVSIQRIVGFAVSPGIKKIYSDAFAAPVVIRAVFAEVGKTIDRDQYFVVGYDGEFASSSRCAVIAGTPESEESALASIAEQTEDGVPSLRRALEIALKAWAVGRHRIEKADQWEEEAEGGSHPEPDVTAFLAGHLKNGAWQVEAAVLERDTPRESKFRMLQEADLAEAVAAFV